MTAQTWVVHARRQLYHIHAIHRAGEHNDTWCYLVVAIFANCATVGGVIVSMLRRRP